MSDLNFLDATALGNLPPGTAKAVDLAGRSILLCNSDDRIFAVENRCSHAEATLDCGRVRYGWVSCPAHGSRFDLETGEALTPPATEPIATFAVRVVGDRIEVAL